MATYNILTFIGIVALFAPILFVIINRLTTYKTFPILIVFYVLVVFYSLISEDYISVRPEIKSAVGFALNIVEIPLMLLFINYFSTSQVFTNRLRWIVGGYVMFETAMILIYGFTSKTINIILLPGLLLTFGITAHLFYKYLKAAVFFGRRIGKTIITASLMFNTGVYIILYLLIYVAHAPDLISLFVVYYLGTIITSATLCTGIVYEGRHVVKLHETLKVRKELADVYKNTDRSTIVRSAPMLDFDRELWN